MLGDGEGKKLRHAYMEEVTSDNLPPPLALPSSTLSAGPAACTEMLAGGVAWLQPKLYPVYVPALIL